MSEAVDGEDPARIWDQLSRHYDRQLWLERASVATAVSLLAPSAGDRCLDVGTGTGEVLRQLRGRASVPETLLGIDASPKMLARVGPLPRGWSVRTGDVRRLAVGDRAVDVVSAAYILHLLSAEDLAVALGEIHRVLAPGGRLVTVTPAVPARGIARPIATALDALSRRRPARYRGLRALDPRPALERAGFTVSHSEWSLRGYPSICVLAARPAGGGEG